jgi:hypothetical membrane protein
MNDYTHKHISMLFQVSTTTLAILVSLGLALPQIFPENSPIQGMTSFLWYLGIWLNMGAVFYSLLLYLLPVDNEIPEWPTRIAFGILLGSYLSVFAATIGIFHIL